MTVYGIPTVPIVPVSHVSQRCQSDNLAGKQLAHWLHWRDSEISSQTSFYTRNILFWGGRCQRISYKAGEEEAARSWKAWESHMERWLNWSNPCRAWEWWRCCRKNFTYLSLAARLVVLISIISTSVERVFSQVKFIIETIGERGLQETLELRVMERVNKYDWCGCTSITLNRDRFMFLYIGFIWIILKRQLLSLSLSKYDVPSSRELSTWCM